MNADDIKKVADLNAEVEKLGDKLWEMKQARKQQLTTSCKHEFQRLLASKGFDVTDISNGCIAKYGKASYKFTWPPADDNPFGAFARYGIEVTVPSLPAKGFLIAALEETHMPIGTPSSLPQIQQLEQSIKNINAAIAAFPDSKFLFGIVENPQDHGTRLGRERYGTFQEALSVILG